MEPKIIESLLLEAVAEYKVESGLLLKLIESVNAQFSKTKKQEGKQKIDFNKFIKSACDAEFFEDMLVHRAYQQALGFYFGKKRGLRAEESRNWDVALDGTWKVRVKVASHTFVEFRIHQSQTWRKGKRITLSTLDSPCFVHGEGQKEVNVHDKDLVDLAEKRAVKWLDAQSK